MERPRTSMRRGVKRPAPSVRPQVSAAVGLCGQARRTSEQDERLARFAAELGVPYDAQGGDPCRALANALGQEWSTAAGSANIFVQEEARAQQNRDMLAQLRRERLRRQFYPATAEAQQTAFSLWSSLLPELRPVFVETLINVDPRAALAFYETGPDVADVFTQYSARVPSVSDTGALFNGRLPLVDYARLAVALGTTEPVTLFLRASMCLLYALADLEYRAEQSGAFGKAAGLPFWMDAAPLYGIGSDAVSGFVRAGLPPSENAPPVLVGRLKDGIASTATQWLDWVSAPYGQLTAAYGATPASPVVRRYADIMGWQPVDVESRLGRQWLPRGALGLTQNGLVDQEPDLARVRPLYGPFPGRYQAVIADMSPEAANAWYALAQNPDPAQAALFREALARTGADRALFGHLTDAIDAALTPLSPSRACTAVARNARWEGRPTFARLFAPSTLWLLPRANGSVLVLAELRAPALREAVRLAGARDSM
ncbi:hypothetical protein pneo_cds_37 [Pandoravirus neocaledonia]|uniref:Uncharacterized protein n=1 Tax=Pandoravirus neocaledonia TaxID=2107708 RepID=A0A2U7UB29_9VIRU|nr:hypothetical protein pneo_cds_37 [Pandoravirus neocaledonia]AVK75644.1 hypothetical protein pneo_cds_37 [Pandoravirus neocaledonia]